jgi:hypothetical protein
MTTNFWIRQKCPPTPGSAPEVPAKIGNGPRHAGEGRSCFEPAGGAPTSVVTLAFFFDAALTHAAVLAPCVDIDACASEPPTCAAAAVESSGTEDVASIGAEAASAWTATIIAARKSPMRHWWSPRRGAAVSSKFGMHR